MELVVATHNPSKAEQIGALLSSLPLDILTLDQAGIDGEAVEDGATLEENAKRKALFGWHPGRYCVADDTGLFIDALDGQPGIRAARWAGENAATEDIMRFTLAKLSGVQNRAASFRTIAAVIDPGGACHMFSGEVRGTILHKPAVPCQPKMPYSAIFQPDGQQKVWAQMSTDEENAISHRGQAFHQVRDFLQQALF